MLSSLSSSFVDLLLSFSPVFTGPSFRSFLYLATASVLNIGSQTISQLLRILPFARRKSWSAYNHFISTAKFSMVRISYILCSLILKNIPQDQPVYLAADETLIRRWGRKIFRIGRHYDPVRSKDGQTVYSRGHKWLVLAIMLKMSFTKRPWALPALFFLFLSNKLATVESKDLKKPVKYRSPVELTIIGLKMLLRWFPERRFVLLADGEFNTHELHRFCNANKRLDIIVRCRMDIALYEPPSPEKPGTMGRPRKRGKKHPSPKEAASDPNANWKRVEILWYSIVQSTRFSVPSSEFAL